MSMNQGKLDIVKQEITRLNTDILTISELKWMGMSEFNSDDHYIYYCGQESLSRNGVALIVNKRDQNAVLGCSLTNERMISVYFQGKPFNITVIQVYAPTTSADEAEVDQLVLWRPTKPPRTNTHTHTHTQNHKNQDVLFITGDWNEEVKWGSICFPLREMRKSRDTWNNRQVWTWSSKWSRTKVNRVLSREQADHNKHPFSTTQEMTVHIDITRWSIPLCSYSQWWRSSRQSVKTRPGADCGSDHELLIAKFKLKLKKAGKTTKSSR